MNKKIIFLFIIFALYNCSTSKKDNFKKRSFNTEDLDVVNLKSTEILNVCDSTSLTTKVLCISDKLILNEARGKGFFHVVDLKNEKYLGLFGNIGSGPGEIGHGENLAKDDNGDLQIYDSQQKKIVVFNIELLKKNIGFEKEYQLSKLIGSINTFVLDKEVYSLSFAKPDHRIYVSDLQGNLKDSIGTIPAENNGKFLKNVFAQGHDAKIQFNNDIIALSYLTTPIIQIFNRKNKQWIVTNGPEHFPSIFIQKNNNSLAYTKESKTAYVDIKVSNKYIYALYSGRHLFDEEFGCKDIYVFDMDGNPVKHYVLDKEIIAFDIYEDNFIYGLEMGLKKNKLFKFKI
jgi:hypothetical protein